MLPQKFYTDLEKEIQNLPGSVAHSAMFPKRKTAASFIKEGSSSKKAGVLCLIHFDRNEFWITLTERHTYNGAHSGQVSFPGGKMEATDINLTHTALRETEEEIGVSSNEIQIIGALTELYIPVSNFLVYPYIGFTSSVPLYIIQEAEVKTIFHYPLSSLIHENAIVKTKVNAGPNVILTGIPAFIQQDKIIWGATALILNELREILLRGSIKI